MKKGNTSEREIEAKLHLQKAKDFTKAMEISFEKGIFNSAALLAVNSTISSCNALAVQEFGKSGKNYEDFSKMLSKIKELDKERLRQIKVIFDVRKKLEGPVLLSREETSEIVVDAKRFFEMASMILQAAWF